MPLNHSQTAAFRRILDNRWNALVAELREDVDKARREQYGTLAGATHDSGEESVASLLADLGQAELSRDLAELREVEAAHGRIIAGSYGTCTDCGGDIGVARLEANPAAARCAPCQTRHEKTYR
jgi:DnaK suppressor protein